MDYSFDFIIFTVMDENQNTLLRDELLKRNMSSFDIIVSHNGTGIALLEAIDYIMIHQLNYKKVLLINSGGNATRNPQFHDIGKIFIPTPEYDNDDKVILDDILKQADILIQNVKNPGIFICTSDSICNIHASLPVIEHSCAITIRTDTSSCSSYGVFVPDKNIIKEFLHKKELSFLQERGAVFQNSILVDTGIFYLDYVTLFYIYYHYNHYLTNHEFLDYYAVVVPDICNFFEIELVECKDSEFIHLGDNPNYYQFLMSRGVHSVHSTFDKNFLIPNHSFFYHSIVGDGVSVGDYSMIFNSELSNIVIPEHSLVYTDHGELVIQRFESK